jgi:hypothetical protein
MSQNNFILGAGIAGLISAHYNPSYTIISPEVGGQLKDGKNIAFSIYLHNHELIKQLLDELNIPFAVKKFKIKYYYKGKVYDDIDSLKRAKIIKNKMSEWDYDSNSVDVNDSKLSTSEEHSFEILDTDMSLVIERLKPKNIIKGKVKLINNNRKFILMLDENNKLQMLHYDKLISTMPANDFFYMLYNHKHSYNFNYLPCTYVLSKDKPDFVAEECSYYIYDDMLIYNRITPLLDGSGWIYDITGMPDDDIIRKQIKNIVNIERRYVGAIKSIDIDDFRNIKFIGRFSQWHHNIHVEENIEKAIKIREVEKNE